MKVGIMQPYLFPYIGYFQLINIVDKFIIFDDANYIKKGWINRNNILVNNKIYRFNLPVMGISQNEIIKDIRILDEFQNKKKLLKTICHAYKKAPMFKFIYPILEDIILYDNCKLSEYIENSIRVICTYLEIDTKIIKSSKLNNNKSLRSEDKIIDICKLLNSNVYINPIGGMSLYSKEKFAQNNIELYFIKSAIVRYKQFNDEFYENMSIIDVLMFNSKERVKDFLNAKILI